MPTAITKIEVFGPGCARCQETYRVIRRVVEEAVLTCEVTKVEDIKAMMALGIMATPAIAIDGKVVSTGRVPNAHDVRKLLDIG